VVLEEKCRKMKLQVKEKKKTVKEGLHQHEKEEQPEANKYTLEDLESL
jgi:hypothetical protein